ncbi:phage tail terminator-like protein [Paracoccus sp. (in: a-proteobacteria)]|uniref:phage tail terminator-like protein n=1 Tax=Paracoccus sp. TaxID=267 RepID=UPI0028B1D6B4|nr:phage tail terminator-like protein [Paracoccus sp. (in: a-proteobacteria)]
MKRAPENALKARLATLSGVAKAWPNLDFDPIKAGNLPYVDCTIVRAGTGDDTLDAEFPIVTGRLIATVVTLKGSGEATADSIAEQIAALFPMGLRITASGTSTQIMQPPHIREGMGDGSYWRVPVSVPFQTTKTAL